MTEARSHLFLRSAYCIRFRFADEGASERKPASFVTPVSFARCSYNITVVADDTNCYKNEGVKVSCVGIVVTCSLVVAHVACAPVVVWHLFAGCRSIVGRVPSAGKLVHRAVCILRLRERTHARDHPEFGICAVVVAAAHLHHGHSALRGFRRP